MKNENNIYASAYFKNMDLNSDIKPMYDLIEDEELKNEFEKLEKLGQLRQENHRRYHEVDVEKLNDLPEELKDVTEEILRVYNYIDSKRLLKEKLLSAENSKKILDYIYMNINRLEKMMKTILKELIVENNLKQKKFSITYFNSLDIDEALKKQLVKMYNDLVLFSSNMPEDIYDELKNEFSRRHQIKEILLLINKEEDNKINLENKEKLIKLNIKIDNEINKYKEKIVYLEDLMPEKSKYIDEFNDFKNFCNKIIAYDDTNYDNAKQTYEILSDEARFNTHIKNFEELFIQEIENNKKEEVFIYEKVGIKNLKLSLDYILTYYMDKLTETEKDVIKYVCDQLSSEKYDLKGLEKIISNVVKGIWKNTITDVNSFNPKEPYYFICSNNQFIDEKYQTILITKEEINRVEDYHDYQVGFICEYNDNIMYITENDDIMTVDFNDLSGLKTPIQLEQEFINFKVCNRIALDGYRTKVSGVYYINDGNMITYRKALELSNMYKLPLIELKKDK